MLGGYRLGARSGYATGGNGGANRVCVRPPSAIYPGVRATRCHSGLCVERCHGCATRPDGHAKHMPCRRAVWPTFAWPARQPGYGWDSFEQRDQHPGIMYLSPRYARYQRQSALVDEQMVLASELAAVGGIGAGMLSAEGGMARWPSRHWRVPIESDRIPASGAAWLRGCVATHQPVAMHAGAASNSCRCHSPIHEEDIPRASLS